MRQKFMKNFNFFVFILFFLLICGCIGAIMLKFEYSSFDTFRSGIFIFLGSILICIVYFLVLISQIDFSSNTKKKKLIRRDILEGSYTLYYQPIIDLINYNIKGYEALIRYKLKDGTILTPDKFLDKVRNSGMMSELTVWVLRSAIDQYYRLIETSNVLNPATYISINISTVELIDEILIQALMAILDQSSLDGNCICIEITERDEISDIKLLCSNLSLLKEAGFLIAIDDFGSGYATLSLLNKIPFDILKIDKSFVDNLALSPMNQSLLKSVARWGDDFNKTIVFEGVENEVQINFIRQFGIRQSFIQGYYYSKPLDERGLFSYITKFESDKTNL